MIERSFINENLKKFQIGEYIRSNLKGVGFSHSNVVRTPLGEKIIIYASRPGLVVGRKGQNIKKLTEALKEQFHLQNPQIEINEVGNVQLDANIIAERISNSLELMGSQRFKSIGHKTMEEVMNAGALGIEINISGKIPSSRAKSWRFYSGYLKKCGDVAVSGVHIAYSAAQLKTGTIGIKVSIMPPDVKLPDKITLDAPVIGMVETAAEGSSDANAGDAETKKAKAKENKPRPRRKRSDGGEGGAERQGRRRPSKKE